MLIRLFILLGTGLLLWPSLQKGAWIEACFKLLLLGSIWMIWRRYQESKASDSAP